MKTFTSTDFVKLIREDIVPLSLDEFLKTKQLSRLWDKLQPDDIRVTTLKTKETFYEYCYNFLLDDEPLIEYFKKRLEYKISGNTYKDIRSVPFLPIVDKAIQHSANNTRVIRNIHLDSMLDCAPAHGGNLKTAYKLALETGKVPDFVTVPSVFETVYYKDYISFVVTAKTKSGQVSVFSPAIYKTLLQETDKYINVEKQKLLIPSASWSSPVLATVTSDNYSDIHIVDVQCKVLDVTKELFDYIHSRMLFDAPYKLETFCIPSEKMSSVLPEKYDKIFFCPPYFDLEVYAGENQSTALYNDYDTWLDKYWRQTVIESDNVLKKDGVFSFVMGALISGIPLASDMLKIAEEKFTLVDTYRILPPTESTRTSNQVDEEGNSNKFEFCYILKKY
tara:strand:- start:12092 stop:13267 length:1176 start_codon:yes stop_codon:yes gene_type:complete